MTKEDSVREHNRVPILGFVAFSGTGKTTLLTRLLPELNAGGLRVGVVKHAHHGFDIDQPGKDSYLLRKAGAAQMLVASHERWALMVETPGRAEPKLDEVLDHLRHDLLDLVLVEGFKHEAFPKIEVHRSSLGHPLLWPEDPFIIAVASDAPLPLPPGRTWLDINNIDAIAKFVTAFAHIDPDTNTQK